MAPTALRIQWAKDTLRVSLFYLVGLFDLWEGIRTLLISSVGAYVIAAYVKGPFMPWIGFVFLMGHMSINQMIRQFADSPEKVDITGTFNTVEGLFSVDYRR